MAHANQYLLLYVLDLLSVFSRKSDKNLMTAQSTHAPLLIPRHFFTLLTRPVDLAVIFCPGLMSHPDHELAPTEHQLSQDVLEFLIAHQDWFMLDTPPPPAYPSAPSRSLKPPVTSYDGSTRTSVSDGEGPRRVADHPAAPAARTDDGDGAQQQQQQKRAGIRVGTRYRA